MQTAEPAQVGPIAKGLCGPGLLAHVITAKCADHTPLHRLARQLARALGRNNWGVLGSETSGRTAAVLYTVVGTCMHLGIDVSTHLPI